MSNSSEHDRLWQQKHDKISQINDLMNEYYTISAEHSLTPESDPDIGTWSPDKETGLMDAVRIEEEVRTLECEIRAINYKLQHVKPERRQ